MRATASRGAWSNRVTRTLLLILLALNGHGAYAKRSERLVRPRRHEANGHLGPNVGSTSDSWNVRDLDHHAVLDDARTTTSHRSLAVLPDSVSNWSGSAGRGAQLTCFTASSQGLLLASRCRSESRHHRYACWSLPAGISSRALCWERELIKPLTSCRSRM
jgi:hypothetical protein